MLWELVATFSCAFAAAGIVLMLRLFWKKQPKWLVPASAAAGMLAFQIYSEYTWFDHMQSLLPKNTTVVAKIAEPVFYQPWSYVNAPVLKFAVVEHATQNAENADHKLTQLYLFERRMSAKTLPIAVDCRQKLQATVSQINGKTQYDWGKGEYTENIVQAVCGKTQAA